MSPASTTESYAAAHSTAPLTVLQDKQSFPSSPPFASNPLSLAAALVAPSTARDPSSATTSPPQPPPPPPPPSSHPADQVRAPDPARPAPAAARDVLKDADSTRRNTPLSPLRNVSGPILASAPAVSPPVSPTMSHNPTASGPAPGPGRPAVESQSAPRNLSLTSVSSLSSVPASRAPVVSLTSQEIASIIDAAGSPEAAIERLHQEKKSASAHNSQLWRLVEKQRQMIAHLTKDLDKSVKDKDRYKRKLKELSHPTSAPVPPTTASATTEKQAQTDQVVTHVTVDNAAGDSGPTSPRGASMDSGRKVSDNSDANCPTAGRSDTPNDISTNSSSNLPATPQSSSSSQIAARDVEYGAVQVAPHTEPSASVGTDSAYHPAQQESPELDGGSQTPSTRRPTHQKNASASSATSLTKTTLKFPSPKQASRKAPPAPLQLASHSKKPEVINVTNNIIDPSDSEYEEDAEDARVEQTSRGRRKTREEDDREREAVAMQELQAENRSLRATASHGGTHQAAMLSLDAAAELPGSTAFELAAPDSTSEQKMRAKAYQQATDPAALVRQRALSDAAGMLQRNVVAPPTMSPGLPMSPRPGDRPMNSPLPRPPNKLLNSMPMSPKPGATNLPLSPRAPRQPIPMPPQTPLSVASPHLMRAEAYQTMQPSQLAGQVKQSPAPEPEQQEKTATQSEAKASTPGEIYQGLMVDEYPDLLVPPGALPAIYIKTASSRMRPSRASYLAPRPGDENPVFTLAVHDRVDNKPLWRVEKTFTALSSLDQQAKALSPFRCRLPDKALFTGHAPAKIDARRVALDTYVKKMVESVQDEKAAMVVCKFLSTDAIEASPNGDYFNSSVDLRPDTPVTKQRPYREGYLTKRGKNFGGWKARYFVLDGPHLKYFDDLGGAQLGAIKLQNAQIGKQSNLNQNQNQNQQEDEDNQFRHAFLILEPKKKDSTSLVKHVLCAESDDERDAWVESLLQYVDYRDEESEHIARGGGVQIIKTPDITDARSPRSQKSLSDLRPPSRGRDLESPSLASETMRTVGYEDTVAGEAPIMGGPAGRKTETPSPPADGSAVAGRAEMALKHPNISGPTNLQVIPNDWGQKPPPSPHNRDKKRSIFAQFRGRSSSDLNDKTASTSLVPQDHYATGTARAVFGVPLAEAVEFARPADVTTELPAVVYRCIEYLRAKNAVGEEGIFRLSGSNVIIKGLKDRFNTEGDINLVGDDKYYDIHAVASLLKLYLRELPSSILTRDLHLDFLACLELPRPEKIPALNGLVNRLPKSNLALLQALSSFLLSIVNNAEVNKMNVRNVGIVFAPTLNVPAPLISCFVEDQAVIFGPLLSEADKVTAPKDSLSPPRTNNHSTDLRSPRKQMFQDLPTPAYNQTTFQPGESQRIDDNTGMIPVQPAYSPYQMAPQGDGGYGSLNDALRSPTTATATSLYHNVVSNGVPSARDTKAKRRESGILGLGGFSGQGQPHPYGQSQHLQMKNSMSQLREEDC